MHNTTTHVKRLAESKVGTTLACILCLLWIVSMSVVDGHASSFYPIGWGLAVVVLVAFCAIAAGHKIVQISLTGWLGLGVGGYFLIRCLCSSSLVDSWYESGLLLGAFVFYIAGMYSAQAPGRRLLLGALVLCVLANVFAWWLMDNEVVSIRLLGRPEVSVVGGNSRNSTLFVYKNFSALMLSLAGMSLMWFVVWRAKVDARAAILFLIGAIGLACSFFCGSRVVWLMVPLLLFVGVFLWIMMTIYKKQSLNGVQLLSGSLLLLVLCGFIVDCCFSHRIFDFVFGVDSHLRFTIWAEAWRLVGDAPLTGYGAAAAQWLMSAMYPHLHLPNYVHNEYLQAWVDYGIIGAALLFLFVVMHLIHGLCALASEHVNEDRKIKVSLAFICLFGMAFTALTDFVWHSFSLVVASAFACGVLASPFPRVPWRLFDLRNWAPSSRPHARPLRAEIGVKKVLLLTTFIGAFLLIVRLSLALQPGWAAQWDYDALVAQKATTEQRRAFLADVVETYPDSRIGDHYALMGGGYMNWPVYEKMLRVILEHNPRQIFTAAMLADVLGRMQKFADAELIYRRYYPKDGPDNTPLNSWAVHYATNLFAWSQHLVSTDRRELAFSMMLAADDIMKSGPSPASFPNMHYRSGVHCWVDGGSAHRRSFIANCRADLELMKLIGVQPDHSWKAPLEPGGKPALYSRYTRDEK